VIPYTVREATLADVSGIREVFARAYGQELTEEEWRWKFQRNPDGWLGVVAESEGRIVGNFAGWAMRFLLGGRPRLVYSAGDVATDPAARGLGKTHNIYGDMAQMFYESARRQGVPFTFGFPHARAHAISNRLGGTRDFFPVQEVHVPCEAFREPPPSAAAEDFVGETFDELWTAASAHLPDAAVRDRARTNWRFHARPTRYYRMIRLGADSRLDAWAALSVVGERGIVADYLGREADGRDLPPLFAAAASEAARLGARSLVFWKTPGGPGRRWIDRLPGQTRDAGFAFIGRIFDASAAEQFLSAGQFVPSIYDVV
jgi:predicted N-acetyltransferase YhbS